MGLETELASTAGKIVDGIPVVGHIKGGIHYASGDMNGGRAAMMSATRTTALVGGGVLGGLAAGPMGAFGGAVTAGLAADAAITAYDTETKGEPQPYGTMAPFADTKDTGKWMRAGASLVCDGLVGLGAGSLTSAVQTKNAAATNGKIIAEKAVKQWSCLENLSYDNLQKTAIYVWQTPSIRKPIETSLIGAMSSWYGAKAAQESIKVDNASQRSE